MARRAGAILAVADVERSVAFYRDAIGFEVEALYEDPPYATLALGGTRLSLAEQGHPAEDRPGVEMQAPADPATANVVLVVEVDDARAEHERLGRLAVPFLAEPYEPPWGGCRFFCVDPDGYLVEIEQTGVGSTEPARSEGSGFAGAEAGSA
jgi:catechol 2,3-dioxygenase-like lactoylglutathione lyase family enzyme